MTVSGTNWIGGEMGLNSTLSCLRRKKMLNIWCSVGRQLLYRLNYYGSLKWSLF